MQWMALSAVAGLLVLWGLIRLLRKKRQPELKLIRRKTLLESKARAFKQQLEQAVGDDFEIFARVRLADLVSYPNESDTRTDLTMQQIQSTSADFVLVDRLSGAISCVLLLGEDDRRKARQKFIRQICRQCQLPFLQFDVHNAMSDEQIHQKITALLEPTIVLDEQETGDDIKVYIDPVRHDKKSVGSMHETDAIN